jgi:hypothetical protein
VIRIDSRAIYERDSGLCGFCGQHVPWEVVQLDPLSLRVPADLLDCLKEIARAEDRTLNAQVVRALREWIEAAERSESKP